jgi:tetratricopeptide (TPR) repeat protein
VTGEDSGEFIAAAWVLGIPHPPGYPLFCLLANGMTNIPIGGIAWRVNLMSALFAVLTVGLLSHLTARITRSALAAVVAGLALACSREFWEQALIAEVYTLNLFLVLVALLALWEYGQSQRVRWLYLLAVAVGLALATHNTILLLAPLFAAYALWVTPQPLRRWPTWLSCTGIALAGLLFYLYLPIRSAADPPLDWGNPETLDRAWAVMIREQYRFMMYDAPRSLGRFGLQMFVYLKLWLREFTPWVALAGLAGILLLLRQQRAYTLLLLMVALVTVAGFSLVQNFGFDKEWIWVMTVFGLPAYAVTALGAGVAAGEVGQRWGRGAALCFAAIAVLSPLLTHFNHNNRSDDYWARDYARNVLETLPPDAVLVPETDLVSFGAVYLQTVEGRRPDVTIARKYGYVDLDALPGFPAELRESTGDFPPRRHEPLIFSWLLEQTERPVFFEKPLAIQDIRWSPAGLLYQALCPSEQTAAEDYWSAYTWHTLDPQRTRGDYTAEAILLAVHLARARDFLGAGDLTAARAAANRAITLYGEELQALNNAGVLFARYRHYPEAKGYFRRALSVAPGDATVSRNLSQLEERQAE